MSLEDHVKVNHRQSINEAVVVTTEQKVPLVQNAVTL